MFCSAVGARASFVNNALSVEELVVTYLNTGQCTADTLTQSAINSAFIRKEDCCVVKSTLDLRSEEISFRIPDSSPV